MSGYVAGWYADCTGEAQLRYWDGWQWTASVAPMSSGPTTDPQLLVAATQIAAVQTTPQTWESQGPAPLLDCQIYALMRGGERSTPRFVSKRRLVITDSELAWGDERIAFSDVTGISYLKTNISSYGIPTNSTYSFSLYTPTGVRQLRMASMKGRNTKEYAAVFSALTRAAAMYIQPSVVERKLIQAKRDGALEVANLIISPSGVTKSGLFGQKHMTWDVLDGTVFSAGNVEVHYLKPSGKTASAFAVKMDKENAVVLPELLHGCMKLWESGR